VLFFPAKPIQRRTDSVFVARLPFGNDVRGETEFRSLADGRAVRTGPAETPEAKARKKEERDRQKQRAWLSVWNEELWTRLF
jgi:hypothetical protein